MTVATSQDILIVDDEVGIRELLSEILQDEGYRVALAENAHQARAYRQRQQPALVLLDIWMPDTDGVTLLREWGASGQLTMPVVMMSGHGTIETAVEATRIGAIDFLEKPIGLAKLLSTIARALKSAAVREPRRVSLAALGTAQPVRDAERAVEQVLAARKPLLLLGESGTGHDAAARVDELQLQIVGRGFAMQSQYRREVRRALRRKIAARDHPAAFAGKLVVESQDETGGGWLDEAMWPSQHSRVAGTTPGTSPTLGPASRV